MPPRLTHFLKTLTLLITFEQWVQNTIIFDPVIFTLEFDPFFENFNLANNF